MTHVKFSRRPFETGLHSLVDDIFTSLPHVLKTDWNNGVPVNIREHEKGYVLEIIAPGFEKSDFKINVEQDTLTVSAEKKTETGKTNGEKQIRSEYAVRNFKRSFRLDEKTDASGIEASYVNGILILNLPRKESVKTAQEIKVS
jgi:HSP20 family protein